MGSLIMPLVEAPFLRSKGLDPCLFALLYLVVRRLFGLAGGSGSEDLSKDTPGGLRTVTRSRVDNKIGALHRCVMAMYF